MKESTLKKQLIDISESDTDKYQLSLNVYAGLPRDYYGSASKLVTRSVKNVTIEEDKRSGNIKLEGKNFIVESFLGTDWRIIGTL